MNLSGIVRNVSFSKGRYEVEAVLGEAIEPLLIFAFDEDDEEQGRRLPKIAPPEGTTNPALRASVANALVRAGAAHPGLRDRDLAALHAAARESGHVELFVDINALTQGLVTQLAKSLGSRLARIVASSSTIDVLHEWQRFARQHHDGSPGIVAAWELARGMRLFREFKVPVYVHQLAPGAARYFRRAHADGRAEASNPTSQEHREEPTYISEDRQMIAGFWNYLAIAGPRIPMFLVTADLTLAHVCAAERVPFIFARAPKEASASLSPEALWFDPYALGFRTCLAQAVLWELTVVFGAVNVRALGEPLGRKSFGLRYEPRNHTPGEGEDVAIVDPIVPMTGTSGHERKPRAVPKSERLLKLSLLSILDALPTDVDQRVQLASFKPKDEDSVRQFWQIGEATGLFQAEDESVAAGPKLAALLEALKVYDYVRVNAIFRAVSGYAKVLGDAGESGSFPSSKNGGAATGWAIVLGAAYKTSNGTRFGLQDVTDDQFDRAVTRAHADTAGGRDRAVPLYRVLDRVCSEMGLSPVRFEAMLNRGIGRRGLSGFEAQRAKSAGPIPAHKVLTYPTKSFSASYLRELSPGEGITVGGKLVGSLVRRSP